MKWVGGISGEANEASGQDHHRKRVQINSITLLQHPTLRGILLAG